MTWVVLRTERAEIDIDQLASRVARLRGPEYVGRWDEGLSVAIDSLADFPGPRSFPRNIEESERRRAEVRVRLYNGPDKKPATSVACHIFFALYDPTQGEETGRVLVLRVIGTRTQAASDVLKGTDSSNDEP
ncbi:type II toxin-antitoxin system RelE/ParE family toxin [Armatimonas rosea]|uniref:type II toxin-antitoxin system RelE/ParE family toxin n=1 Tax=Armatimonas rosea TaxID=685828 RepID=UPI0016102505|nr:type II toxin-antitoxin system RelE/ParE family toxin [Armatimonas rosea]